MVIHYEANRYFVQIDGGGVYLVDLDEFNSGWCNCRDFECRHLPTLMRLIDKGEIELPKIECKHIIYLRSELEKDKV